MGEFRNIFKELRKAAGLSQAEMAKRLGISRSTVGMYETGQREPDFETLEVIADFFNVDVDYLIGRTNKTTNGNTTRRTIQRRSRILWNNTQTSKLKQQIHNSITTKTNGI